MTGTLAGVAGTLVVDTFDGVTGRMTAAHFARTTAGSAVACPANTPFVPDVGVAGRTRIKIRVTGENDAGNQPQILASLAASYAYDACLLPWNLVGSVLTRVPFIGTSDQTVINNINTAIQSAYPNDYVDLDAPPTVDEMSVIGYTQDTGIWSSGRTDAADIAGNACGSLVFGVNPSAMDTVTIGGTTITFVLSGAAGSQVNIGADAVATAAALAAYVNANSGSLGVTAVSGVDIEGAVRCTLVAVAAGAGGNSIALAKSSSAITLSAASLTGGSAIGVVPSGMRRGAVATGADYLHGNNAMYALWALRFYRAIVARGWLPTLAVV
jgi:hypothetical protein